MLGSMTESILVPTVRTLVTFESLAVAFDKAYYDFVGELAEIVDIATICGKLAMECGHPNQKQCCWCWNIGNCRGVAPAGTYCILAGAYEFIAIGAPLPAGHTECSIASAATPPGMRCVMPPASQQGFRAYASLDEACADYVHVLGARFGHAWRELTKTDTSPDAFIRALKADRYFTGDVETYAATVASIAKSLVPKIEALLQRDADPVTVEFLSILDGGAATPLRAPEAEHTVRLMPDPVF